MLALIAFLAAHIPGALAFLVLFPEATIRQKLAMALAWEAYATWAFFWPIFEDLFLEDISEQEGDEGE